MTPSSPGTPPESDPPSAEKSEAEWEAEFERSMAEFDRRRIYDQLSLEILGSIPDDLLEQAVVDLVLERIGTSPGQDPATVLAGLPGGFRDVYSTWVVEAEVDNGGFNQLFWNAPGWLPKDAAAGFERLGLVELARLVDAGIAIHQQDSARLAALKAEGTLEAFSRSYDERPYAGLDLAFHARGKAVSLARIAYVRSHPERFVTREGQAR